MLSKQNNEPQSPKGMSSKRIEGRDEPIVEPDLPIIDSHFHLFRRPELTYLLDDYLEDLNAGHRFTASVYVETRAFVREHGPEHLRPLGEVEFANGVAAMSASGAYGDTRVAAAIVGHADMRNGDQVGELLDASLQTAPDRFRGVRQITLDYPDDTPYKKMMFPPTKGILDHPGFRKAFRHLAPRGLTYDAAIFHNQLPDIENLAADFPDTTIILNHMGLAMGMDMNEVQRKEVFQTWRQSLKEVARHPNVLCKVGGLGMPLWGFGFEEHDSPVSSEVLCKQWRPYIESAIEVFGPDRCMMEGNYPPDSRSCGFVPLWNALKMAVQPYTADEKAALFYGTAAKAYRL